MRNCFKLSLEIRISHCLTLLLTLFQPLLSSLFQATTPMSVLDRAVATLVSQIALAADGAVLGVTLTYFTVRSFLNLSATSSALRGIDQAPSLRVSDLRSLLSSEGNASDQSDDGKLVIVRGIVEAKSAVDTNWKSWTPNVLVSHGSGKTCVVIQRTQTCIYNDWSGISGLGSEARSLFGRSLKELESTSLTTVPFILVEGGRWPQSDYVIVNMDGSRHSIPLMTVYHHMQPVNASPFTFLQALFGNKYPVGLLDEEKILPRGKDITAVGICSWKNGIPEVKSCKDLPYFLSDLTKDEMVVKLTSRTKVFLWSGIALGALSIVIIAYSAVRNWKRLKEWRQQRRFQQQNPVPDPPILEEETGEEETGDVPEGQHCVICWTSRRCSAFYPCGHLVCCIHCAQLVAREIAPKCPFCRQAIQDYVRIYDA